MYSDKKMYKTIGQKTTALLQVYYVK